MSLKFVVASLLLCASASVAAANAPPPLQETIIFVRHGEKPTGGYGQLTCQGLNRALALPSALYKLYGKPTTIFAPDPGATLVADSAGSFDYVRPLATIEPTAIQFTLPVNTPDGFTNNDDMSKRLTASSLQSSTVFVASEHVNLVKLVKKVIAIAKGDTSAVPDWSETDFDSIYKVVLTRDSSGNITSSSFEHDFENLNGMSTVCPTPNAPVVSTAPVVNSKPSQS